MWIFRFVLTHFAQNDKALVILTCFVILSEAKYP